MTTPNETRRRFRALLAAPEIIAAPGVGDPLTGLLCQTLGITAIHVSGSVAHRTHGYSDAGILTLTEMVDRIAAMSDIVDLPLIADADTGFGGAVNVVRTVKDYERAGAAAIHFEDQVTPKRPTYQGSTGAFISTPEMVDKIRAAVDTRIDPDLAIIARCDVPDRKVKLERLQACLEAGADVGWLSSEDAEETLFYTERFAGKPSIGVLPRGMTLKEYQNAGASCALLPGILPIAALCAQKAVLEEVMSTGSAQGYLSTLPAIDEMTKFYNRQGNDELKRIEDAYSGTR
jgi:2-methylisocitrate lyase-like PEP mutase family enzyme